MLTPQEVSSHAFPKAVMGGSHMGAVDEFLDELTDDYTSLYKENAGLKAKMKVLVEKVEDYRATEDSMRATLLTAQKMADSIVKEAEAKRDELMRTAEGEARERLRQLRAELNEAEARLRAGQAELAEFVSSGQVKLTAQIAYLGELSQMPVETPEAEEAAAAEAEERAEAEADGELLEIARFEKAHKGGTK
jgi:cell division initiation protein